MVACPLALDPARNFFPVNADVLRRVDADADLIQQVVGYLRVEVVAGVDANAPRRWIGGVGEAIELDEAVAAYLEAVDLGQEPDQRSWLDRYPEVVAGLRAFFQDKEMVDQVAAERRRAKPRPRREPENPRTQPGLREAFA